MGKLFDLHSQLSENYFRYLSKAKDKGTALSVTCDPRVPWALRGNPDQLQRGLSVLLGDAVGSTDRGWVGAHCGLVSHASERVSLEIEVAGSGWDSSSAQRLVAQHGPLEQRRSPGGAPALSLAFSFGLGDEEGTPLNLDEIVNLGVMLIGADGETMSSLLHTLRGWGISAVHHPPPVDPERIASVLDRPDISGLFILFDGISSFDIDRVLDYFPNANRNATVSALSVHPCAEGQQARFRPADGRRLFLTSTAIPSNPELFALLRFHGVLIGNSNLARAENRVAPINVLIVEDDPVTTRILSACLSNSKLMNFSCDTAENGAEALQKLSASDYHIALTDLQMNGIDGMELLRRYKESAQGRGDPCRWILLTGEVTPQIRNAARAVGFAAVIEKPLGVSSFAGIVAGLLGASEKR